MKKDEIDWMHTQGAQEKGVQKWKQIIHEN
jgi:hypothetical protein